MDEKRNVYPIPYNFQSGINIFGLNFKPFFLFEGIILFAILTLPICYFLTYLNIKLSKSIGISLIFGLAGLIVGLKGINDEPITSFIRSYILYKKKTRIAYYNPRVKQEAASVLDKSNNQKDGILSKDNIMSLYQKFQNSQNEKNYKRMADAKAEILENSTLFFEDDIGVVDKPFEYMNRKERREYLRRKKKGLRNEKQ